MSINHNHLNSLARAVSRNMRTVTTVSAETTDDPNAVSLRWNCPSIAHKAPTRLVTLIVPLSNLEAYALGVHVQSAFPTLSDRQRECLMLGFCPSCVDDLYDFDSQFM